MLDGLQKLFLPLGAMFLDLPLVDPPFCGAPVCRVSQFSVCCEGQAEYPEDDPIYGTFLTESVVDLGAFDSLDQAIAVIEARTAGDDIGSASEGALSFSPRLFKVSDDDGRLVCAGEVRGEHVNWCVPVVSDEEAEQVSAKIEALQVEASFEMGWDNFSTARRLRFEASVLEGRLVDPLWRDAARTALPMTAKVLDPQKGGSDADPA